MISELHAFVAPIITLLEKPSYICPVDSDTPDVSDWARRMFVERGRQSVEISVPIHVTGGREKYYADAKAWIVGRDEWIELTPGERVEAVDLWEDAIAQQDDIDFENRDRR